MIWRRCEFGPGPWVVALLALLACGKPEVSEPMATVQADTVETDSKSSGVEDASPEPLQPVPSSMPVSKAISDKLSSMTPVFKLSFDSAPGATISNDLAIEPVLNAYNVIPFPTGFMDGALRLDSEQRSYLWSPVSLIGEKTEFALSCWFVSGKGKNQTIFAETHRGNHLPLLLLEVVERAEGLRIRFFVRNDNNTTLVDAISNLPVEPGKWTHVLLTRKHNEGKLFLDGQLDVGNFGYPDSGLSLNQSAIGAVPRDPPVNFFNGLLDEFAIYDRSI